MAAAPYALLATLAFALGTTLQQRGALQTEASATQARFYVQIFTRKAWLLGGLFQILGGILQLVALAHGPLVVVEPILAFNLVFALPLGHWLTAQEVRRRQVTGACVVTFGVVAFVVIGQPEGGSATPTTARWLVVTLLVVVAGAGCLLAARGRSAAVVAGLVGGAAGIAFGFEAAIAKEFTHVFGIGISHTLTHWSTYALIVIALVGSVLEQASLKAGVLPPAMAALGVLSLLVGVALGVALFGDRLAHEPAGVFAGAFALAITVVGLIVLVRPTAHVAAADRPA